MELPDERRLVHQAEGQAQSSVEDHKGVESMHRPVKSLLHAIEVLELLPIEEQWIRAKPLTCVCKTSWHTIKTSKYGEAVKTRKLTMSSIEDLTQNWCVANCETPF